MSENTANALVWLIVVFGLVSCSLGTEYHKREVMRMEMEAKP